MGAQHVLGLCPLHSCSFPPLEVAVQLLPPAPSPVSARSSLEVMMKVFTNSSTIRPLTNRQVEVRSQLLRSRLKFLSG
ncbi:hypothetical protein BaRGS_00007428 [Batillaria attramentaria]|uniref:Uncharacterized protein n=1 Tax=Batillaria attramentaria TaxID=370345 RepID=A0ABD0LQL6_9CAEN